MPELVLEVRMNNMFKKALALLVFLSSGLYLHADALKVLKQTELSYPDHWEYGTIIEIAISSDGEIYSSELYSINHIKRDGKLEKKLISKQQSGYTDDTLKEVAGLFHDPHGYLVLLERSPGRNRIILLNKYSGKILKAYELEGIMGRLFTDYRGRYFLRKYVSRGACAVWSLDKNFKEKDCIYIERESSFAGASIIDAISIDSDSRGNLYILDGIRGEIDILDSRYQHLSTIVVKNKEFKHKTERPEIKPGMNFREYHDYLIPWWNSFCVYTDMYVDKHDKLFLFYNCGDKTTTDKEYIITNMKGNILGSGKLEKYQYPVGKSTTGDLYLYHVTPPESAERKILQIYSSSK